MEDHERLDQRIDRLESDFAGRGSERGIWKRLWAEIKAISEEFKRVRYSTGAQRKTAWDRFQEIVGRIKEEGNRERAQGQARRETSQRHLAEIRKFAERAEPESAMGRMLLEGIGFVASHGLTFVVKKTLDALGGETDEEQAQLRERSEALKEGWAYLSQNKGEMFRDDKDAAFALLQNAKIRLDSDWQTWKAHKNEAFEQRRQQREERHRQWVEKQEEWRAKQKAFIERLESAESKLESVLEHKQSHLEDLFEKLSSARSDDFRDRVAGWTTC
jgi:uncharacterized coiled-coil protein SlyX